MDERKDALPTEGSTKCTQKWKLSGESMSRYRLFLVLTVGFCILLVDGFLWHGPSAGLTATVGKTSAGAVAHVPVARVPNLPALLKELKEEGVWVFGAAMDGSTPLYQADLKGPAAIVIGSEGSGLGRLVEETCDFTVSIPMFGKINSLNASAAAAVLLYEAVRQRTGG